MKKDLKLFNIFGIDIKIHFSWWFIFIFLAWSLSTSFFPQFFPDYPAGTYWLMGILAALLLFFSVLLHELSHSLVAKARQIKVESITLFFFGGVAGITDEDIKPLSEFLMALAGPLFSILLGFTFYFINQSYPIGIIAPISFYLYQINIVLGIFNLLPGFPLDGGRAFRAILHAYYHDLKKATRIASSGGKFCAGMLIMLGILAMFNNGSGIWFILVGAFLYYIAGKSYEQILVRETLRHLSLQEFIVKPIILNSRLTLREVLDKYARTEHSAFVIKSKGFTGILDLNALEPIPRIETPIRQLAVPLSQLKPLHLSDNVYTAFQSLQEHNLELLPVQGKDNLVWYISRRRIWHRVNLELKFNGSSSIRLKKKKV